MKNKITMLSMIKIKNRNKNKIKKHQKNKKLKIMNKFNKPLKK